MEYPIIKYPYTFWKILNEEIPLPDVPDKPIEPTLPHKSKMIFGKITLIGFGIASLLDDAKQKACQRGLQNLKSRGIEKPISDYYKSLITNN